MQFNSYSYLLCLALAVAAFWLLPVRFRRVYVLVLSVAFYATWNPFLVFLPLGICAITYGFAKAIAREPTKSRWALRTGIGIVILVLAVGKYRGFVVENLSFVIPWIRQHPLPAALIVGMPLGISFYSFEAISYLLDTRQKRTGSANLLDLALFILFWPHLIAGPIVRSRELIPQLKFDRPFEHRFLLLGLDRLLWGLVQKNLIANNIGPWVDDGFLSKTAAFNTTADNWFLAVAFGLQIYYDFAAYSNMAIGAARLIGITLPENFRFPYHAATPVDFWSRWHMTLSRWIRDYVFFPLNAGFADAKGRLYVTLVLVMGVVGLWHGAGWGFVVWGLMHGVYLAIYRMLQSNPSETKSPFLAAIIWRGLTVIAVIAAWIPFRAATLGQAGTMLSSMFWRFSSGISYSVNFYLLTVLFCVFTVVEPYLASAVKWLDGTCERRSAVVRVPIEALRPVVYAVFLLFFLMFDDRDTQFIYFQF
jgi:alginate O-acetyltransferase complex protein AlgI